MAVVNEVLETQSELERDNTRLYDENKRFKDAAYQAYHKLQMYEGPDANVWDAEIILAKAILNQ